MNSTGCAAHAPAFRLAVFGILAAALSACGEQGPSGTPAPSRKNWRALMAPPVPPPPPDASYVQWSSVWSDVRRRITELRAELTRLQTIHVENHFDTWLGYDPATLNPSQTVSLYQFLRRGYFTVEREAVAALLERRAQRAAAPSPPAWTLPSLADRARAGMAADEITIIDLETALHYYRLPGNEDIYVPPDITSEELTELRAACRTMQEQARSSIAVLDARIASLKEAASVAGVPLPGPVSGK